MPVIDRIKDFQNDLVAIRRDIHDKGALLTAIVYDKLFRFFDRVIIPRGGEFARCRIDSDGAVFPFASLFINGVPAAIGINGTTGFNIFTNLGCMRIRSAYKHSNCRKKDAEKSNHQRRCPK